MNHNALRDDETYYAPNFFGSSNTLEQAYDSMLFLCKLCAENLDAEKSRDQRALYCALSNGDVRELCLKYARRGYNLKSFEYPNSALFTSRKIDFYFGYASDDLGLHFYVLVDLEQRSVVRIVECFGHEMAAEPLYSVSYAQTMARLVDEIPDDFSLSLDRIEESMTEAVDYGEFEGRIARPIIAPRLFR